MKMAEITSDKSWSCLKNEFNKKKDRKLGTCCTETRFKVKFTKYKRKI